MRPVNLIPVEERRGERTQARTGPLVYILIGVLVMVLGGVALMVQTGNRIDEAKSETTRLKGEVAVANAQAQELSPYTQFHDLAAARTSTVQTLADSRFDWQRVIREFSLVVPEDVQIVCLRATVRPDVIVGSGGGCTGVPTRTSIPGPAIELLGCTPGQDGVARLVTALHQIDGVTRVGVSTSALPGADGASESSSDCQTRPDIAAFEIVMAFDAAPVTPSATAAEAVVSTTDPAAAGTDPAAAADATATTDPAVTGG